jgi:hypothetical protein
VTITIPLPVIWFFLGWLAGVVTVVIAGRLLWSVAMRRRGRS